MELERVNSVKVLDVTIAGTLQWNCHISDVLKKANKRMFFLILLKRAKVPVRDIISFFLTCCSEAITKISFNLRLIGKKTVKR